jgi:hypothetical protein
MESSAVNSSYRKGFIARRWASLNICQRPFKKTICSDKVKEQWQGQTLMNFVLGIIFWVMATLALSEPYQLYFLHDGKKSSVRVPHVWTENPDIKSLQTGLYELVVPGSAAGGEDQVLWVNSKHIHNTINYQVYRDGQEVFRFGNPEQPDRLEDMVIPGHPLLLPASQNPIVLRIKVTANRHTLWPGIHQLVVEPRSRYEKNDFLASMLAAALMGAIVIVGMYHAMLWYLSPRQRNQIIFVAYCAMVFIFASLHISRVTYQLFQVNVLEFWLLQTFAWFGTLVVVDAFSFAVFPKQYPRQKVILTLSLAVVCWLGNFFSLYSMLVFQVYSWIYFGHIIYFAYRIFDRNRVENILFTCIYSLLIASAIADLASGINMLNVPALTPFLFFGIVCLESYLLSYVNQRMSHLLFEEQIRRQEIEESLQAVQGLRDRIDQSLELIPGLRVHSLYQPAERFGGDWLSFTYLRDSRQCIILIGDVTGHGMGSGLLSVSIGATIHGALSVLNVMGKNLSVQDKLDYIAQAIHFAVLDISKRLNKGMTMALVGIDLEKGQCVVRNHGHTFPYLVREKTTKVLMARGSLLGSGGWDLAEVLQMDFKPGDGIFVYTDGLLDNINRSGRALPRRGLEKILVGIAGDEKGMDEFAQYSHGLDAQDKDADDLACLYIEWRRDDNKE